MKQTLEESKEQHFTDHDLSTATHHSLLFLDLLQSDYAQQHSTSTVPYSIVVIGAQCGGSTLKHLWKYGQFRICADNSISAVHGNVPASASKQCI